MRERVRYPQSRYQSQEIGTHPALDSTDEGVRVQHMTVLPPWVFTLQKNTLRPSIETGTPPHITRPPFPISEVSLSSPSPSTHITRTSRSQIAARKRLAPSSRTASWPWPGSRRTGQARWGANLLEGPGDSMRAFLSGGYARMVLPFSSAWVLSAIG